MPLDTLTTFVAALTRYRLLSVEQLEQCPRDQEPRALARELVQRGWLTPYQVNELFFDRGDGLLLGSYILLDKIGEGGMGTVYKARNWKLDKLVALKVIKKDRLLKPDTIKRFYREIRAVAQLDHPNIVRAYDADEVNETHFFVMEYVEGSDLNQLVKKQGPLPIREACDYIRQAALGLQHAFERGLVHRDIKPHNLLLASGGRKPPESAESQGAYAPRSPDTVKVLDMGLALVENPTNDDHSGTMTQSGIVMGTPDYMAPEQSLNAHDVDIRADLYSLGCTLYFLLVGRVPFAGGTLTQKLLRHQNDAPESVKKHRPDVPDALDIVVFRLLAKRPEDRYQSPRELALALETIQTSLPTTSTQPIAATVTIPDAGSPTPGPSHTQVAVRDGWAEIAPAPAPGERPTAPLSRLMVPMLAVLAVLILAGGGIWWATHRKKETEPVVKRPPDPPRPKPSDNREPPTPEVVLPRGPATDEWVAAVQPLPPHKQVRAVIAKLKELNPGFNDQPEHIPWEAPDGDKVLAIAFGHHVTDLTPIRALKHLKSLTCNATPNGMGAMVPVSLADLSPLKGLPLQVLRLSSNRIEDLTPLIGMNLTELTLHHTTVRDLTPLKDMTTLQTLYLMNAPVADLSPIRNLSLAHLSLTNTAVKDLTPLAKMPLRHLFLAGLEVSDLTTIPLTHLDVLDLTSCPVVDLSPLAKQKRRLTLFLQGVPFRSLEPLKKIPVFNIALDYHPRLEESLRGIPSLEWINGLAKGDFWKYAVAAPVQSRWLEQTASLSTDRLRAEVTKRLRVLNPGYRPEPEFKEEGGRLVELYLPEGELADLRFVSALKALTKLTVRATGVESLEPLRGLSLRHLTMSQNRVVDLSPLADMPLEHFESGPHAIREVSPLKATRLRIALISNHAAFQPLGGLSSWAGLPVERLKVRMPLARDLPSLSKLPALRRLSLSYVESMHRDVLRSLKLEEINDKKPDEFWKEQAEQQVEFVRRELVRLNGELTKFEAKFDKGFVTTLAVKFNQLNDLRPLRTLTALTELLIWGEPYQARPLSLEPLRGLPLDTIRLSGVTPENLDPLRGKKLGTLGFSYNRLNDLSLLKGVSVRHLHFNQCKEVSDLSPLRGMALESLGLDGTAVKDLSPLQNMPLSTLGVSSAYYVDLTPVAGIKTLRSLSFSSSSAHAQDLRCLEALPLESLNLRGTKIVNLSPLIKLKLQRIGDLDFQPFRGDADVLRAIPTLQLINNKNAKEFLKEADDNMAAFQKWCDDVAKLSGISRVDAVIEQLKIRNPDWKDTMNRGLTLVGIVEVKADGLTDPTPLRALPSLRQFGIGGENLNDLWFLHGMKVERLNLHAKKLEDLTPLCGMPLKSLSIQVSSVSDLSPLRGMPLEKLAILHSPVADLRPLRELPHLKSLHVDFFKGLTDLSPLQGLSLESLSFIVSGVIDLTPLRGMPLTNLHCDFVPMRDAAILKEIKTLKTLNDKPASELLK